MSLRTACPSRIRTVLAAVAALAAAVALAGCAGRSGPGDPVPTPVGVAELQERLTAIDGVTDVFDSSATEARARAADPTYTTPPDLVREVVVHLDRTSDDATVLAATEAVLRATSSAGAMRLSISRPAAPEVLAARDGGGEDWRVQLRPATPRGGLVGVRSALDIVRMGPVTGVVIGDWSYAEIDDAARFSELRAAVGATPGFARGGTYTLGPDLDAKHLQIVHRVERTSAHGVDAVIALAADYPDAEVLLQSTLTSNPAPRLYVAKLRTAEEQQAIAARLSDPALADADVDGYPMQFILSSSGEPDVTGTFGGVPLG